MLALILPLLLATCTLAVPTIEAKGSKFFASNGNQWYIKGVAYQLTADDPLAQGEQCKLDASLMKKLGANTIRVYHVDPSADHDACMSAFADAGIYVFLDLDTFDTYVLPNDPTWNTTQYKAFAKVMDTFHGYDNVAGFFVANELINTGADSIAAPYVKAAAVDMKNYRDSKGYRKIPIGYSAADIAVLRPNLQNFMACGESPADALDFFSLNAYEWCGDSSFEESGYSMLQKNASDYDIPIFLSETGCNAVKPRTFGDQAAVFGPDMAGTWSGAIIYEWIQEANDYGLVSYGASADATATATNVVGGFTRAGTPTPISPDFDNLSREWATLTPTGISAKAYSPSLKPPKCPASTAGAWDVNGAVPLPTVREKPKIKGSSSAPPDTAGGVIGKGSTAPTATEGTAAEKNTEPPSGETGSATGTTSAAGNHGVSGSDIVWKTGLGGMAVMAALMTVL